MSKLYEIPILSRGRVILPSEGDAVEFSGRNGARFRCPDPHKHVNDLVLGDAGKLMDLHNLPMSQILDFLAALGPRLKLSDNPYLQQSYDLAIEAGGLTKPLMTKLYDSLPALFTRSMLEARIECGIGIRYLDSWAPQAETGPGAEVRVRAVGCRQLHIIAGNVPITAPGTVITSALTKGDCLIKTPSNDPLTASAVVRTMIDMDPNHPVTKHFAVAYWKGGDAFMDSEIIRTTRIDKITAWGGMSSMQHIQKYLVPGIDLVAMNPKYSFSIVGKEVFASADAMKEAATGVAIQAGKFNQTACASTRIAYVESETDNASVEQLIKFGELVYEALQALPNYYSTPAAAPNAELEAEMRAIASEDDFYWVKGDTIAGGVIVSKFEGKVDFSNELSNRVVNIVPLTNWSELLGTVDDTSQTIPVFPASLRLRLRDELAVRGAQRMLPLSSSLIDPVEAGAIAVLPHDGNETLRRSVRWMIDQGPATVAS
jgi:hypothetical protein